MVPGERVTSLQLLDGEGPKWPEAAAAGSQQEADNYLPKLPPLEKFSLLLDTGLLRTLRCQQTMLERSVAPGPAKPDGRKRTNLRVSWMG